MHANPEPAFGTGVRKMHLRSRKLFEPVTVNLAQLPNDREIRNHPSILAETQMHSIATKMTPPVQK
jgi:hypothetical protein